MIMAKDSNNNYVNIEDIRQQNSFNGISPTEFKGNGENLENYRIYGNTTNGKSVGNRTGNLFDGELYISYYRANDGQLITDPSASNFYKYVHSNLIPCTPQTTYTLKYVCTYTNKFVIFTWYSGDTFITSTSFTNVDAHTLTVTAPLSATKFGITISGIDNNPYTQTTIVPADISNIMLNLGDTALPYEPYGYRVPVTVNDIITNLYLPEPIKMVGDEAEYVDYATQKQHRVRKNLAKNNHDNSSTLFTVEEVNNFIYVSGTNNSGSTKAYKISKENVFPAGSYDIVNNSDTTIGYDYKNENDTLVYGTVSANSIKTFNFPAVFTRYLNIYKSVPNGESIDNYFQVMVVRHGTDTSTYEPYIENTEVDVTLPALPTLSGTNTLTVGTNTKPSKVWGRLNDPRDILYLKDNLGNILFNKYHEIEGEPPLIYKAKKAGTLIDYRIYGQTESGESVGDRTGNLFDETIYNKNVADSTLIYVPIYVGNIDYVTCSTTCPKTITGDYDPFNSRYIFILSGNVDTGVHNEIHGVSNGAPRTIQPLNGYVTIAYRKIENHNVRPWEYQTMLNVGSTALPYEPYGYKVPVTVEGNNLFDYDTITHGYRIQWSSGANYADETAIMSDFISVSENSTYATDTNLYWLCYDANKQYIGAWNGSDIVKSGVDAINSMTAISPCKFIRILSFSRKIAPISSTTMLNCGSTALPYESYHAPITTPIYLPEPIKMVGDEAEYVDYAEQKQHRVRKNLLKTIDTSQTLNGVTYTVNSDRSVTCNGLASSLSVFMISIYLYASTSYILNGCPLGGSNTSYRADLRYNNVTVSLNDYGAGVNYNCTQTGRYDYTIRIASGYTCDNLTFYPMIRKADIQDDTYEPYIGNTDLDVTLPALPTVTGTNTLSVETEIQPSKINIKGKIKGKIYGWHVDPDISNSSNAVTYLKDAIGMTPASMGSTTFDYGSWENAFFMPKPCMLKSNGKVDYYLDPNDYTKKLNGTASDISNPNYDGNAMMQWPKIWFKYVKGVKEGQGYFYVANYKADGNFHCWCNYDSENNEIDHFYTAIYNGTSFANYSSSKTYVINDFAIYDNKLYKCNTAITTAESFDNTKWDLVSNTAPAIDKMRSLSGIRLTNNNGNAQTTTTTEITRATANNTTSAVEWYIETFSDRLLINGLLVLIGKSLNTQAVFGRGLDTGEQSVKEAYVTGTLNNKGLFWGVTKNGNSGVKVFGMENFWGCCWHRTAGLITNNHAVKLKLTYGTKDGSTVIGYNQTGNGYIDNGTAPYSNGYVQKMSYNKYGFMPAVVTGGSQSTYYADDYYQNANYTGAIYAVFGGCSDFGLRVGVFQLVLSAAPEHAAWSVATSLSCKPLLN